MKIGEYSVTLEEEDRGFVSICPELDIASQGDTKDKAVANLREAVELFLEVAPDEEVARRKIINCHSRESRNPGSQISDNS